MKMKKKKSLKSYYESDSSFEEEKQNNELKKNCLKKGTERLDIDFFYKLHEIDPTIDKNNNLSLHQEYNNQLIEKNEDNDNIKNKHLYYVNLEDLSDDNLDYFRKYKQYLPEIDSFDLEKEKKNGKFDIDGNYIENESESESQHSEDDHWYNDCNDLVNTKDCGIPNNKKHINDNELQKNTNSINDAFRKLIDNLKSNETPLDALSRLKKYNDKYSNDKKDSIDLIIHTCSELSKIDTFFEIYFFTKEKLEYLYKTQTKNESKNHSEFFNDKIWEFKWKSDEKKHNYFTSYEMDYWKKHYFKNNVVVKKKFDLEYKPVSEIDFKSFN